MGEGSPGGAPPASRGESTHLVEAGTPSSSNLLPRRTTAAIPLAATTDRNVVAIANRASGPQHARRARELEEEDKGEVASERVLATHRG